MKSESILLLLVGLILSGCSTHFYKVHENDVTLYLRNADAQPPLFACSLDGYATRAMVLEKGFWVVTLPADNAFRYFYLVDGKPILPSCTMRERDDFGSENCIFEPEL